MKASSDKEQDKKNQVDKPITADKIGSREPIYSISSLDYGKFKKCKKCDSYTAWCKDCAFQNGWILC
jgi:hypothetical protein